MLLNINYERHVKNKNIHWFCSITLFSFLALWWNHFLITTACDFNFDFLNIIISEKGLKNTMIWARSHQVLCSPGMHFQGPDCHKHQMGDYSKEKNINNRFHIIYYTMNGFIILFFFACIIFLWYLYQSLIFFDGRLTFLLRAT